MRPNGRRRLSANNLHKDFRHLRRSSVGGIVGNSRSHGGSDNPADVCTKTRRAAAPAMEPPLQTASLPRVGDFKWLKRETRSGPRRLSLTIRPPIRSESPINVEAKLLNSFLSLSPARTLFFRKSKPFPFFLRSGTFCWFSFYLFFCPFARPPRWIFYEKSLPSLYG